MKRREMTTEGEALEPWDHPYEGADDSAACKHCGFIGSYAHSRQFYEKWVWPALQRPRPNDHPEATCERCHRPNVWSWHVPSPLWNAVMRDPVTGSDAFGIVCPPCFAEMAESSGVVPPERHTWHFAPHDIDVEGLWTDKDGRVWDAEQCLWIPAESR